MSIDRYLSAQWHLPRDRSGSLPRLLIVCLALIALLGIVGSRFVRQPDVLPDAEVEAVRFLDRIREGDVDVAWEATTAEFKSFIGRERLRKTVAATPVLQQPCELVRCQPAEVGQLKVIECLFRPTEVSDVIVRVLLGSEQGRWRVERLEIQDSA